MSYPPYKKRSPEELILRDELAIDRTSLANERTFLAYVRTGLSLGVAGVSFIRFFDVPAIVLTGWALIPMGLSSLVIGALRFWRVQRQIDALRDIRNS